MTAEPTSADLTALFGKPPKEVVDYFQSKAVRGPKQHWDWSDTLRHSHDRAFTVSKATSLDLVKDIKAAMQDAMAKGVPYQQFANSIIPTLQARGWWGKQTLLNKATGQTADVDIGHRRLRQIFDVNMKTSYDAGKHFQMMAHAEEMPYWRYRALPQGPTRRQDHQHLNNLVFRYDDPFWASHKPRNGWGCQCDVEEMDKRLVEHVYKRPVADVVKQSSPDDFTTKTVTVQGKELTVIGYKTGSDVVYPDPGWDYAPGDFAWRSKQLLADKIMALPSEKVKTAFLHQMQGSFKKDFAQFVLNEQALKIPRGDTVAVGILDEATAAKINGRTVAMKTGERKIQLETPLLLARDKDMLHALRDTKEEKELAMPAEMLATLPDLLSSYTQVIEKDGGILFFSEPFNESARMGGKGLRWKIVFDLGILHDRQCLYFRTATKVPAETIYAVERMK